MSTLRTAATFFIILLALGMGSTAPAQSESRPVYPFVGEASSANYRWTENLESAVVWVFQEPVPPEGSGGRLFSEPIESSQWPDRSALVGKTSLRLVQHPEYRDKALRTVGEYRDQQNGKEQRYLFVIETSNGIYCSRALEDARGNRPRYYTLSSPAHVRVGQAHPDWKKQAHTLVSRLKQAGRADQSDDSSGRDQQADATAPTSDEESSSRGNSTASTDRPSTSSDMSSTLWFGLSVFGWWKVGFGLLAISVLLLLLFWYFSGSSKKQQRRREGRRKKRGGPRKKKKSRGSQTESSSSGGQANQSKAGIDESASTHSGREVTQKMENMVEDKIKRTLESEYDIKEGTKEKIESNSKSVENIKEDIAEIKENMSNIGDVVKWLLEKEEKESGGTESTDSGSGKQKKTSGEVASVFTEWCQTAGGRVRKIDRFQDHLGDKMRQAQARSIQYERDSMSDEFLEDASNGVTYWLVEVDGEHYVLPHPTNRSRFGNLQPPVYQGDASPKSLEGIEPAQLTREAGRLVLDEPGRVW